MSFSTSNPHYILSSFTIVVAGLWDWVKSVWLITLQMNCKMSKSICMCAGAWTGVWDEEETMRRRQALNRNILEVHEKHSFVYIYSTVLSEYLKKFVCTNALTKMTDLVGTVHFHLPTVWTCLLKWSNSMTRYGVVGQSADLSSRVIVVANGTCAIVRMCGLRSVNASSTNGNWNGNFGLWVFNQSTNFRSRLKMTYFFLVPFWEKDWNLLIRENGLYPMKTHISLYFIWLCKQASFDTHTNRSKSITLT